MRSRPALALAALLALAACATTPHADLQRQAWAEPWTEAEGWHAATTGTCRQRAMWVVQQLGEDRVRLMTGYRLDQPDWGLHVVPVIDRAWVLDADGVWPLGEYDRVWQGAPWRDLPGWVV